MKISARWIRQKLSCIVVMLLAYSFGENAPLKSVPKLTPGFL